MATGTHTVAWLLALLPLAALAAPTIENPEPHITIFRDGDHFVTLVGIPEGSRRNPIREIVNEDEFGEASLRKGGLRSLLPTAERKYYWVRVRVIDGSLVCEKFAELPRKQRPDDRAAELFKESCS